MLVFLVWMSYDNALKFCKNTILFNIKLWVLKFENIKMAQIIIIMILIKFV
jgi:hypothetical protein